jgi:ABC-type Fe3+ transport system substrate-binding protein
MVAEVLVYAALPQAMTARAALTAGCHAVGVGVQLELYSTGSLYQRLGPRHASPLPDLVMWFGPFAAQAAAMDNLLQPHQPRHVAPTVAHDLAWRWTTLDYWTVGAVGTQPANRLADLAAAPTLALPDPERAEAGMAVLLAMLDRARTVEGDVERGWAWWHERARKGLILVEDDADAETAATDGRASNGLTIFSERGERLDELAPIPNAVGLATNSQNVAAARELLDWLTSDAAAAALRLSPWQAGTQSLMASSPSLDVDWARAQYTATRQRWARSGFGPATRV